MCDTHCVIHNVWYTLRVTQCVIYNALYTLCDKKWRAKHSLYNCAMIPATFQNTFVMRNTFSPISCYSMLLRAAVLLHNLCNWAEQAKFKVHEKTPKATFDLIMNATMLQCNIATSTDRKAVAIVGKSDFVSGILILKSIFPNFSEYFS